MTEQPPAPDNPDATDLEAPPSASPNESENALPPNLDLGGLSEPVDISVEEPAESGGDALGNLFAKVRAHAAGLDEGEEEPQRRPYRRKRREQEKAEESIRAILSGAIVMLFAWIISDEAKPDDEEADGMAAPLARLINRHIPITGKWSEDLLDILAFVGEFILYYKRIRPLVSERREAAKPAVAAGSNGRERLPHTITPAPTSAPELRPTDDGAPLSGDAASYFAGSPA